MGIAMTPEERNDRAYRRLMVLVDDVHLSSTTPDHLLAVNELIDHVQKCGDMLDGALLTLAQTLLSGEVANEQPIGPGAFERQQPSQGTRLQPGRNVAGLADVEPGENGMDGC